jgi:hypothetical protein
VRRGEAAPSTQEKLEGTVSPKKLAANRANAQRSTGPTSEEGKARSRFNAVKHGLTARYFPYLVIPGSVEVQQLEEHRRRFYEHFAPVGPVEELLVEKIIVELGRYNRAVAPEQHPSVENSGYFPQVVDKLTRYQSAVDRQLMQAITEIDRLQTKRNAKEKESSQSKEASD